MAETVLLDPALEAVDRVELDLTPYIGPEGPDWGDAGIEAYRADAQVGQLSVDSRLPNRVITIPLQLMDNGIVTFATIRRQVQAKAAIFQREGGWISRQTSEGTVYADVVPGTAMLKLGGSSAQAHGFVDADAVLTLECIPDWYGAEVELDDIVETTEYEIAAVLQEAASDAMIAGDYPARCRIVIDDDQVAGRQAVIFGMRSRNYSADATAALAIEAEDLNPAFGATVEAEITASGGSVVEHATLTTDFIDVLGMDLGAGYLTHAGLYRVFARVLSIGATPRVRIEWAVGGTFEMTENTPARILAASRFELLDLGEIRLDPIPGSTHRWHGNIQAAGDTAGDDVWIDKVYFVPVDDGYAVLDGSALTPGDSVVLSTAGMFREDTGVRSRIGAVIGNLPRLPPSGLEERVVEILIRPTTLDGLDPSALNMSAQVFYRPSYLFVGD